MKKILALICLIGYTSLLSAQNISVDEARNIAASFVTASNKYSSRKMPAKVTFTLAYEAQSTTDEAPAFYVFSKNSDEGFVIVAGDNRARQILGYSDSGTFDYPSLPPNAKSWIDGYQEEIEYLRQHTSKVLNLRNTSSTGQTVAPLLGDLAWNQDSPYNDQCPRYDSNTRCATGCVATAMAQIMYYHKWPETGNGTHTYSPSILNGGTLTADFGNTHYNWSSMLPEYLNSNSTESRSAVAQLMLHCGISVDMDYSSSSGALGIDVPYALAHYFNYDKAVAYRVRNNYSYTEWNQIIKNELNAGRPVFATGYSSEGGHAFVFDGYDEDGFIHVNWGWGKMSNGYFQTTALTPASQGIGGSKGGFNYKQAIVTGIQTPVDGSEDDIELVSTEGLTANSTSMTDGDATTIALNGKISNADWKDVVYDYGLILLDATGDTLSVIPGSSGNSLGEGKDTTGTKFYNVNFGILKDGRYKLYPACRTTGGKGQWFRIRDNYVGYPNYLTLEVSNHQIHFITPDYFDLQVKRTTIPAKIYSTVSPLIKATLINQGDVEYYGEIKSEILDKTTGKAVAQSAGYMIDLNPGDSTEIQFTDSYTVSAGNYDLNFIDDDLVKIDANHAITVMDVPSETAVLAPAEQLSFDDNDHVDRDNMTLTTNITCTQGVFGGQVYLYLYSSDGNTQMGCLNPEYIYAAEGDTVSVTFTGPFENGVPGTNYMAYLVKYDGTYYTFLTPKAKASCLFRLDASTGITAIKQENTTEEMEIYYLNGQKLNVDNINSLPHGIYIIKKEGKSFKIIQ